MQAAQGLIGIAAQGPKVRVIAVGGHQDVVRRGWAARLHHDGRMIKPIFVQPQLEKVPHLDLLQGHLPGKGPRRGLGPDQKIAEIGHPRPGRGLVVGI